MNDAELDHIAIELTQSNEARESRSYLYLLGLIWQKADPGNRVDLRLAMLSAVEKHDLRRLLNYEYGEDTGRRMVEECASVHLKDLRGIAPDATGEQTSVDFVRAMREEWES